MNQEEFYSKIPEWIAQEKSRWNHVTYLAFFCHYYKKKHGVEFRLVAGKKGVTMGKEARDFSKLFKLFAPDNYSKLPKDDKAKIREEVTWKIYNYIKWMFDYKFRSGQKSVNGTRLFHVPAIVNEFERMYGSYLRKQKTENKMDVLISWAKKNTPEVLDSHQVSEPSDLLMILNYSKMYNMGPEEPESLFLNKAKSIGVLVE